MAAKLSSRIIFFIGWLLSPFTFWNDAFVNIPISYLCASLAVRIIRADFLLLVLISYWLSNGVGVIMMYAAGKTIIRDKARLVRELAVFLATIAVYSAILVLLNRSGILKPI